MDIHEDDANRVLTLEIVLGRLHQEVGKTTVSVGRDLLNIPDFIADFLQGKVGWGQFHTVYTRSKSLGYPDLVERATPLIDQARDIWLEKGYVYVGALLTGREHKESHSSGFEQFLEAMPDTVVKIANQTLRLYEEKDPMSIEEIRRARILLGMSNIDDTGTVTGEIVPIEDSYHFLPKDRKAEVIGLEGQVISGLREIAYEGVARHVKGFVEYEILVQELAQGKITRSAFYTELKRRNIGDLKEITDDARKVSYLEGHKDDILTPMELMVLGREVYEKYKERPYTPLGIQEGILSVEEANRLRVEERFFDVETDLFTGYLMPFALSLEPLNNNGETRRGPLVLDHIKREPLDKQTIELFKERVGMIPFSRPTDWYHKPVSNTPPNP